LQALTYARQQRFDLIVLDLMMPEMDGRAVLAALKRDPQLRHIPVIIVSALDEIDDVVHCIEAGAEDYLTKPINTTLLYAKIDSCLERKRLRDQEQAYLMAMRYELELARRTQADFLPATLPSITNWHIAAKLVSAREMAGDFYDVFHLSDQRWMVLVGDVCDKGVGAALFMALTRTLLRAFAEQAVAIHHNDPLQAVMMTNEYIARHHHGSRTFSTIFCAVIDTSNGALSYINAGHPPPYIFRSAGGIETLEPTGPAVGWIGNARFTVGTTLLEVGDSLFAYTDGSIEARAADGTLFGEERLLATVTVNYRNGALHLEAITQAILDYSGRQLPDDDITLLAVCRLGSVE
jgi:serine phosphatase RsbU (regulator of sigma subunit)